MRFPTSVLYFIPGVLIFAVAAYVGVGGKIGKSTPEQSTPETAAVSTAAPSSPAIDAAPVPTANDTPVPTPPRSVARGDGPECRIVNYFDQSGALVAAPQPVAGLMLAGTPITGPVSIPPGAVRRDVGASMECPQSLIDQVQGLFDESCFSDIQRKKTAQANNIDLDAVNKRCADMGEALHPLSRQ